jgi:hypothetical protein
MAEKIDWPYRGPEGDGDKMWPPLSDPFGGSPNGGIVRDTGTRAPSDPPDSDDDLPSDTVS